MDVFELDTLYSLVFLFLKKVPKMHSITKAKLNSRPKREYLVNILIMDIRHFHFHCCVQAAGPSGSQPATTERK